MPPGRLHRGASESADPLRHTRLFIRADFATSPSMALRRAALLFRRAKLPQGNLSFRIPRGTTAFLAGFLSRHCAYLPETQVRFFSWPRPGVQWFR